MTKRKFLDAVFALAPNEANKIMDAFDEYVESNEPHWIPVTERLPTEGESVLLGDDNKNMTLGRLIRTDGGYKWDVYAWWHDLDDWSAWMPLPEPFKGVTE